MWSTRYLSRIDFRVIPVLIGLILISLLVISAYSVDSEHQLDEGFFTPLVRSQIQRFALGSILFVICSALDYNKLREWTWLLYAFMILSLLGLFFTDSIQRVHRWYKVPLIGISIQPSEYAKLIVVIALSWFLERRRNRSQSWGTVGYSLLIVGIPFILILKQPDLGTALVLLPMALVMFYFGGLHPLVIRVMTIGGTILLCFVALVFLGVITQEQLRPYATLVLKEYQFERFNPESHHQKASATAIAIGGWTGVGWRKSEFTANGWLPAPYTDSVFPAFGEEFGLLGLFLLLVLFYTLIYFSFQVSVVAKDDFGRLLAAGIAVYLTMHVLVNVGMMCGVLPITGVPLPLVTYGGSSVLATMAALGILQSIYSRRFMF